MVEEAKDPRDITDKVVAQPNALKKTKFEEFTKKHAARIAMWPTHNGKKQIPVIWNEQLQDWVWISRRQRRHLERKSKR